MMNTSCARCGAAFTGPLATRSDKKFCGNACRQAAWRDDRTARAREVRALLAHREDLTIERGPAATAALVAGSGERVAQQLQDGLDGLPPYQRRLDQVLRELPEAEQWFGRAALVAAASGLPSGACRWCSAARFARVHELPAPRLDDPATRELLGAAPCAECRRRVHHDALVASGTLVSVVHAAGDPALCYRCTGALSVQAALVAGRPVPRGDLAVLTSAQQPHEALPLGRRPR